MLVSEINCLPWICLNWYFVWQTPRDNGLYSDYYPPVAYSSQIEYIYIGLSTGQEDVFSRFKKNVKKQLSFLIKIYMHEINYQRNIKEFHQGFPMVPFDPLCINHWTSLYLSWNMYLLWNLYVLIMKPLCIDHETSLYWSWNLSVLIMKPLCIYH